MKPKLIAHRANLNGPDEKNENSPAAIRYALTLWYDIEIDAHWVDGKLMLGHDKPTYEVPIDFLYNNKLWVHCKTVATFHRLKNIPVINAFFHNEDDCALTTQNITWCYPRASVPLDETSVAVLPEKVPEWDLSGCYGVCTDFPIRYRDLLAK